MIIGFAGILLVVTNDPVEGAPPKCVDNMLCHGNIKYYTPGVNYVMIQGDDGNLYQTGKTGAYIQHKFHQGQKVDFSIHTTDPAPYTKIVSIQPAK